MKPAPPTVEAQSLNHRTASEVPKKCFSNTDQQKYNVEQVTAHILLGLIWLIFSTSSSQTQKDFLKKISTLLDLILGMFF